jgi:bifunctional N-acetylglucosamine-1-phosphate-uridyltransferase/glucosamine-1-phosphate-acetyltransferase GlmU-like protein
LPVYDKEPLGPPCGALKPASSRYAGELSNSTLVAPLEIGEGSYVGAGSVITNEVPPGSLALGRGRQVIKEGWVEEKKKGA